MLKTDFAVPHQVYFDAKHYVEHKRILFFDFYRNCAFGFVRTSERGGHFTLLVQEADGSLNCHCKCQEAEPDEVCGHGFAMYLKLLNWPFEKVNLAEAFEKDPLIDFLKSVGRSIYNKPINDKTNPWIRLPEGVMDTRMAHYLGFYLATTPSKLTMRDLKCQERAQSLVRTKHEVALSRKGFPSTRMLFEGSRLYSVCKMLFLLQQSSDLQLRVDLEEDHHVLLSASYEGNAVFGWKLPVDSWLKGVSGNWEYWEELAHFPLRSTALPVQYRIAFNEKNDLEIEPMVEVSAANFQPLSQVTLPNHRNLYYHPHSGYFRLQAGLSFFEMEFSEAKVHLVGHQNVKKFLKDHQETFQGLDRSLIDDGLFGEVVIEHFHNFKLSLTDFKDDLFSYKLKAQLGNKNFSDEDLRTLFAGSGRYRKLAGKLFDTAGYDGVYLKPIYDKEGSPSLSVAELFRIVSFFRERLSISTNELTREVYEAMNAYQIPDAPSLDHTKLTLREYQVLGYEWLCYLQYFGLGGLLCDQMGLGKTHQGMALMAGTLITNPDAKMLVVAPASVIYHWRDKLKAFCPGLSVTVHHGPDRNAATALNEYNVTVTTFATLRNDIESFTPPIFDVIIFDEIQNLKNKSTKAYREIIKLQGLCKIGLTGTPIENDVGELKALMDIVFPGFLGSDAHFKRYFFEPITEGNNQSVKEQLRLMVHPFTLRRNKSEVLSELPEKTEDVRSVTLSDYELELYNEVKRSGKKKIKDISDGGGFLHVFALINQLKQLCDHPALYFKNDDYHSYPCNKWDMFKELAEEVMTNGEKLVVFTQYLGMVEIFQKYFTQQGIAFATITGKTKHRDKEQERFQTDPNCRVFIGTIKAAGVGIDLTAATVLVHYDRWWNAAREEQATDRIHRIGQNRPVQIYKFCTTNTVEQRINDIIERKRALLNEVVGFDSEEFSKVFNMDELLEILA